MQPLVQKQHQGRNYPPSKYVSADAAVDTCAVCGDRLFPCVFCKRLIYVCGTVCAQISRYFLWPLLTSHRLSFFHLKRSLSSPLWKWAIFFGGLSDAAEDAGEVLVLPHSFRSQHCSLGVHTVGYLWYHTVLQPPPALIWEICWCLPPLQVFLFFFVLIICISMADVPRCCLHADNACQTHGNNSEWETLPLLVLSHRFWIEMLNYRG